MLTTLARRDRENRGFTLVELAGVILVIAILAAIAIPVFQIFQQRSRGSSMTATAENFTTSLVSLSQQAGRSANDGRDIADSYEEIPSETQQFVAIDGWDGAAWQSTGTGAGEINATDNNDFEVLRIVQAFGDNVRAGCMFLPSQEAAGETPVFVLHGTAYNGPTIDWEDDGTDDLVNGEEINVTVATCREAAGTGSATYGELEGVAIEDASGNIIGVDYDADGTAEIDFDDA